MDDKILKKNIVFLMKSRGMTQQDLASILNYEGAHSVNQWLKNRTIPFDVIEKIADYFELSSFLLKNIDLESIADFFVNDINLEVYYKLIFPYEVNDTAFKNANFKKAYDMHMDFFKFDLPDSKDDVYKKAFECYKLYKIAFDEGIIEGLVNMISISSLYKMLIKQFDFDVNIDNLNMDEDFELLKENEKRKILKEIFPYNDSTKRLEINNFIINTSEEIYNLLLRLKESQEYKDIVDYYLAILHANNLLTSEFSSSDNMQFGLIYTNILYKLKNKYAVNLQEFTDKSYIKSDDSITQCE